MYSNTAIVCTVSLCLSSLCRVHRKLLPCFCNTHAPFTAHKQIARSEFMLADPDQLFTAAIYPSHIFIEDGEVRANDISNKRVKLEAKGGCASTSAAGPSQPPQASRPGRRPAQWGVMFATRYIKYLPKQEPAAPISDDARRSQEDPFAPQPVTNHLSGV